MKNGGAEMRDAPAGNVVAACYTRLFGKVIEERDNFVLLQIGGQEHGIAGWFSREDLAFGRDGYTIPCGFPSYAWTDGDAEHLNEVLRGLPEPLTDDPRSVWLIGMDTSGDWLVLLDTETLFTAAPDAFSDIGEPEEYYDPRYHYRWDEDDLRTLEYTWDETGLKSLRIIMEDAEFLREDFPPRCDLDTDHDDSAIWMDYYWDLPPEAEGWDEILWDNYVSMTFEYLGGKWALTACTDGRTWRAEVENGRFTFMDYDRPADARWQWQASMDDDLMTFDFSSLDALIAQYYEIMPNRPSVAGEGE